MLTHQFTSEISLLGMGFDAIGGLYLAYDLLGGKSGPLKSVTRIGSYISLFLIGFTGILGLRFAIVAAIGLGILLAAEYRLAEVHADQKRSHRSAVLVFGVLRGLVIGLATMTFAGFAFGALFAVLLAVALTITYALGFSYDAHIKERITKRKVLASLLRVSVVIIAGMTSAFLTLKGPSALAIGLKLGLASGTVNGLIGYFSPNIEWWFDNISERRLGVLGLGLIFLGALLQSVQYWVVVLNIPVN